MDPNLLREWAQRLLETADFIRGTNRTTAVTSTTQTTTTTSSSGTLMQQTEQTMQPRPNSATNRDTVRERGFVEALTRFHYRRLEKQKTKLNKENSKTPRDGHTIPISVSKKKIDSTKLRAMAANLQKQYNEVNRILSQLNDSTENKNCEKYSCESVKCVTNSTGGPDTDRVIARNLGQDGGCACALKS